MVSRKQLVANRENAKRGGVKTAAGKLKSKYNAVKHGILCETFLASMEDKKLFDQLRKSIQKELKPKGIIEVLLAERIIICTWRLRRCSIAEKAQNELSYLHRADYLNQRKPIEIDFEWSRNVVTSQISEKFLRYETTNERKLSRLMQKFRDMQRNRINAEDKQLDIDLK